MAKKHGSNSEEGGDYEVGYGRPPKSGQIKLGEVRNPWGRNGKRQQSNDLLLKVAEEVIQANLNGRAASMTQEEAAYRRLIQEALRGDPRSLKLLLEHLSRRRPPVAPVPTPEELVQQQAELEQRTALSDRLVQLLEASAGEKKKLAPRKRYGPDLMPVAEEG